MRGTRWRETLNACLRQIHREFRLTLTPPVRPQKWVFVVGCYNSGTELLVKLLGSHPAVAALPVEGQFLTDQFPADYELGLPRMWVQREDLFRLTEADPGPDVHRLKREWAMRLDRRRPIFLKKSPPNAARTRWLQHHFENAHFIAIVRNGYAVAEGIRRKAEPRHLRSGWPLEACARQWARSNEVLLEDAEHLERITWVRYEDLVADPAKELERLLAFLELDGVRGDWLVDPRRPWSVHEKNEPIRDMNRESIARLTREELELITRVAGPMLTRFGYEPAPVMAGRSAHTPSTGCPEVDPGVLHAGAGPRRAPLSILHVAAPAQAGGLEQVVTALAAGHSARGHVVRVAAILDREQSRDPLTRRLPGAGVEVLPIVLPVRAYGRERAAVALACATFRPDVVHTHGYRPDVLDAPVARRLGIPIVTTVHGFTGGGWKNRLYERLQTRAFRRFDAVVAVSRPLVDRLVRSGVPRSRVHLVPNAWAGRTPPLDRAAARQSLGLPLDGFRVGWVGRLTAEKGADVLVDALGRIAGLPVMASVIGDGRERAALEVRARELGVGERITWHGMVADAARLYRAFDVFVLSSRTEGTPIALFEAMAAGVPVIASRVGGVPDVVSPAEALLVPAGDAAALAAAIRMVFEDPAPAAARAAAAHARLERDFAPDAWLDRYEALYRALARHRNETCDVT